MTLHHRLAPLSAVLLVAITGCASTPKVDAEESYVRTADGALLHYRRLGDGPEVVLAPSANWLGYDLDALAEGRTLIFYDMRGRGRSDRAPRLRMEKDLEDLEEVRAWFELERFALMGFDYSAAIVAGYAAQNPDRVSRLLLISPLPIRKNPYWDVYNRLQQERMDPAVLADLEEMRARRSKREVDLETWSAAYRTTVLSTWVADRRSLDRMKSPILAKPNDRAEQLHRDYKLLLASLGAWDWRETMRAVACPTLIVQGTEDAMPKGSLSDWLSTIPNAREVLVARSGRLPWVEQPASFVRAAEEFLPSSVSVK